MSDKCGYTETTTGHPCQHPAESCPVSSHTAAAADGGRPSKFTEDRRERILEAAENGATIEGCARAGGVTYRTLRNWLDQGEEEGQGEYFQFLQSFERARAKAEQRLLKSDRTPPTFILERSYGYTKKTEHEHTGEGGGPIEVVLNESIVETPYED